MGHARVHLSHLFAFIVVFAGAAVATAQPAAPPKKAPAPVKAADTVQYAESASIGRHNVVLTAWHDDVALIRKVMANAKEEISRVSRKLDANSHASEVSAINRIADNEEVVLSAETFRLVEVALQVCRSTGRAYDPAVQSFDYLWHFQRRPAVRPLADELLKRAAFARCDLIALKAGRKIRLMESDLRISLGELAVGHALEQAANLFRKAGVTNFRIQIDAHAYVFGRAGTSHWFLNVPHPTDPSRTLTQLYLGSHAAATRSQMDAFFMRDGVRYHDILDPRTGNPARGVLQATVISPDALLADALSRAVVVMGVAEGLAHLEKLPNAEGFLIDDKGGIHATKGMASLARLPPKVPK